MTPSILMAPENGIGVPAIVGDATWGKVHRHWWLPVRIQIYCCRGPGHCDKTSCAKQTGSHSCDCQNYILCV